MALFNITGIAETWWNEGDQWDTVIPGYKIYQKDSIGPAVGLVALYVGKKVQNHMK